MGHCPLFKKEQAMAHTVMVTGADGFIGKIGRASCRERVLIAV